MEEKILEQLFDKYGEPRVKCPVEENRIAAAKGNFKKSLNSKQYKQLYRMLDDNENITGKMSIMNFESGLRFGIKFMAEIYAGCNRNYENESCEIQISETTI